MSDADIEKLADAIVRKQGERHNCTAFDAEQLAELHGLAKAAGRAKDYALNAAVGVLVLGLLTATWFGIKSAIRQQ